MNLKIIGTDHLMKREKIIRIIESENPEIIGVELCEPRLNLLVLNTQQPVLQNESVLGKISQEIKKKAEEENLQYGSDMITASKYALENKIPLSLLDRSIVEINNSMQKIPKEEQQGFLSELAKFQEKTLKEQTENIDEDKVIEELKTKYPMAYEILIVSRDLFIAYRIQRLLIKFPDKKILVFLGKCHVNSINKLLEIESNLKSEEEEEEEDYFK